MGYFCFYRLCGKSDDAVNQTLIKTNTGIWSIEYNAEKRTTTFIICTYDFMDCRATKKVETISTNPGTGEREAIIILHQRFLYRGYLQIAACDLTSEGSPKLWHILWEPTQHVATRPLAIQQDDTWYCYGWDLTKNICELFQSDGSIGAAYAYAPFGEVTATGTVAQPFQWSSEYYDTELGMVYYNYRHYNPTDGRWVGRDPIGEDGDRNLYGFINNGIHLSFDKLGKKLSTISVENAYIVPRYGIVKYTNGRRILGETSSTWPSLLGQCSCENTLFLSPEAVALIDVFFYVNEKIDLWRDRFGQNVEEHEMYHVNSYVAYWNAFVEKANSYEKTYSSNQHCESVMDMLIRNKDRIKERADRAQEEYDQEAY